MRLEDAARILGVPVDADVTAVRAAYRSLAFQLHPSRYKERDAKERFQELRVAFTRLMAGEVCAEVFGEGDGRDTVPTTGTCARRRPAPAAPAPTPRGRGPARLLLPRPRRRPPSARRADATAAPPDPTAEADEMQAFMNMFMELVGVFGDAPPADLAMEDLAMPAMAFNMMFGNQAAPGEWHVGGADGEDYDRVTFRDICELAQNPAVLAAAEAAAALPPSAEDAESLKSWEETARRYFRTHMPQRRLDATAARAAYEAADEAAKAMAEQLAEEEQQQSESLKRKAQKKAEKKRRRKERKQAEQRRREEEKVQREEQREREEREEQRRAEARRAMLFRACRSGDLERVKALLSDGDLSPAEREGRGGREGPTLLHACVPPLHPPKPAPAPAPESSDEDLPQDLAPGRRRVAAWLLGSGRVDLSAADADGATFLHRCAAGDAKLLCLCLSGDAEGADAAAARPSGAAART